MRRYRVPRYSYALISKKRSTSTWCAWGFAIMGIVCFISILVIFYVSVAQPCSNDAQCMTKKECEMGRCDDGFCNYTMIDGCCVNVYDCPSSPCIDYECSNNTCVAQLKDNAIACDDNNLCTSGDECLDGMCIGVETDCTHLDEPCVIGVCNIITGNCTAFNANNDESCTDTFVASIRQGFTLADIREEGITPEVELAVQDAVALAMQVLREQVRIYSITNTNNARRRLLQGKLGVMVDYSILFYDTADVAAAKQRADELVGKTILVDALKAELEKVSPELSTKITVEGTNVEPPIESCPIGRGMKDGICSDCVDSYSDEDGPNSVCKTYTTCEHGVDITGTRFSDNVCFTAPCKSNPSVCLDNNPCTLNLCVDVLDCVVEHIDDNYTCIPGCVVDTDCETSYICYDGTCLKVSTRVTDMSIKFIGYDLQPCSATADRLNMNFVLDTEQFTIGNDTRYRVILGPDDLSMDPHNPLGFGNEIFNLNYNSFGNNYARTAFTVSTECQNITAGNCGFLFTNRVFKFAAKMHDCIDASSVPAQNCIDPQHYVWSTIYVSVSDCTKFTGVVNQVAPRAEATVRYMDENYLGFESTGVIPIYNNGMRGIVGIFEAGNPYTTYITDLKICKSNVNHYLAGCVDGTNTSECFNTGCFHWEQENPLNFEIDIIKDGSVTAMGLSDTFKAYGCFPNDEYNSDIQTKCGWDKCTSRKPWNLDDGFEFDFSSLAYTRKDDGPRLVFDIKYKYINCTSKLEETKYAQMTRGQT